MDLLLLQEEVNQLKLENELLKQQLSTFTKDESDDESGGVVTFQYGSIVFRMIEHVNINNLAREILKCLDRDIDIPDIENYIINKDIERFKEHFRTECFQFGSRSFNSKSPLDLRARFDPDFYDNSYDSDISVGIVISEISEEDKQRFGHCEHVICSIEPST